MTHDVICCVCVCFASRIHSTPYNVSIQENTIMAIEGLSKVICLLTAIKINDLIDTIIHLLCILRQQQQQHQHQQLYWILIVHPTHKTSSLNQGGADVRKVHIYSKQTEFLIVWTLETNILFCWFICMRVNPPFPLFLSHLYIYFNPKEKGKIRDCSLLIQCSIACTAVSVNSLIVYYIERVRCINTFTLLPHFVKCFGCFSPVFFLFDFYWLEIRRQ